MAKKKLSSTAAAQEKKNTGPNPNPPPRDLSPDHRMESLKTLNRFLLKETMEKRGQVEQLQSQIGDLAADHSFVSSFQAELARLVLSSRLADQSLQIGRKAASLDEKTRFLEEKVASLESEKGSWKAEKAAVGGKVVALERESRSLVEIRESLEMEIGSLRESYGLVKKEKEELRLKVGEMESRNGRLQLEIGRLESEKEEMEKRFQSKVGDYERQLDDLKGKLGVVGREKDEIEQARAKQKGEIAQLHREVGVLQDSYRDRSERNTQLEAQLNAANRRLQSEIETAGGLEVLVEELKKSKCVIEEEFVQLKAAFDKVVVEREDGKLQLDSLEKKKDAIEQVRARQEVEIGQLQREAVELRSMLSRLEDSNRDQLSRNTELEAELNAVSKHRDSEIEKVHDLESMVEELEKSQCEIADELGQLRVAFDGLVVAKEQGKLHLGSLEKEKARLEALWNDANRHLSSETEKTCRLELEVEELQKRKFDIGVEFGQLKAAFDKLVEENEERKLHIDLLKKEKAQLEKSLVAAQSEIEDMERKVRAAEMVSGRTLSLLRSAADSMNGSDEVQENGVTFEDEILPFAEGLDGIKAAFRSKVGEVEDLNREVELLKSVVADAEKKKGGLWMWLYPATTTVVAAISLAFAARGRCSS